MKTSFLSLCCAAVLAVAIVSCKGPEGSQGPVGQQGAAGASWATGEQGLRVNRAMLT